MSFLIDNELGVGHCLDGSGDEMAGLACVGVSEGVELWESNKLAGMGERVRCRPFKPSICCSSLFFLSFLSCVNM